MIDIAAEARAAYRRIGPYIRETYLEQSPFYSWKGGAEVFLKLENLQYTGSFKVRGALNKILALSQDEIARGAVTASTGNHGAAVAFGLRMVEADGIVFVPESASPTKIASIKRLGGTIRRFGKDPVETEDYAREYAAEHRMAYIPPYNDPLVIGGQATVGIELDRQLGEIDAVFVAVGGGGLAAGIGGYLRSVQPNVQIIGCSPENSQVMLESVKAGRLIGNLPSLPTLSDGTSGGIEKDAITFEACRDLVDEWVTVTEDEIRENLRQFLDAHHMLIEGAAAVAIAAFLKTRSAYLGKNVVLVMCGGNISTGTLSAVLGRPETGMPANMGS